ncbi:hypothetical protein KH5_24450 [Urechidicola sp. KH5]
MDELDKLKGAWKAQDYSEHRVSTDEIYRMLHRKSSSMVKWIFIISILEFVLINSLVFIRDVKRDIIFYQEIGIGTWVTVISILSYAIIIYFIYLFYKNYKTIKADNTAKALMESILNTRKTVKQYIYFNIGFMALTSAVLITAIFSDTEHIQMYKIMSKVPEDFPNTVLLTVVIVTMIVMIGLFLVIYRIIYGILLRRLKKNHKELKQLDN